MGEMAGGRYRTDRPIGTGGMARVFLGRDEKLDREVAIKVLAENLAADDDFRKRFMREARMAAKLSHPNVVQVYDVGEEEDVPFMVMEYVDGRNLGDLLKSRRALSAREVYPLLSQTAAGLAHAHDSGLVHRDVKPHNLLRRKDGKLKIADFGIARALEESRMTDTGSVLGTRPYMAPEQLRGDKISPATDVYAFGVVAHELLAGRLPEGSEAGGEDGTAATRKAGLGAGTSLRGRKKSVPDEVAAMIDACLQVEPKQRPGAAQLAADFAALESGKRATGVHRAAAERTRRLTKPVGGRGGRLGEPETGITERVFGAVRGPKLPRRWSLDRSRLIALGALAAIVIAIVLAINADSGDDLKAADSGGKPAERVEPAPQVDDPSQQATELGDWIRAQAQ